MHLLIVDDEKTTRDSLLEVIPWNELGIANVTIAKNGLEALQLAGKTQPDILLTDIRMPKMDGIELAHQVRNIYPECKIIFLSGYADKDYLKSAIHLQAISYIEKPINPVEIITIIRETVALLSKELREKSAIKQLKNSIIGSRPLIRQEITLELIKGTSDISGLVEKYGNISFKIPADCCFTVLNIIYNWKNHWGHKPMSDYQHRILQALSENSFPILKNPDNFIAGFTGNKDLVLIVYGKIDAVTSDSKNTMLSLFKKIAAIPEEDLTVSIGVGNCTSTVIRIPESFRTAVIAANQQFYFGPNQIYYYSKLTTTSLLEIDKNLYSNFRDCLAKGDQKSARALIENISAQFLTAPDHDLNRVKNIYFHLLLMVFETALQKGLIEPFSEKENSYIWQEIEDKQSLNELSEYLLTSIINIFSRWEERDDISRKSREIMRYIWENYADKDLSIQTIGNHIYLSPTYLCAFFKKHTGKTLNEFITEVRIEKAKEFLMDSRTKLYEIATRVGFTDANYFSTLFKKYVGCTPSDYRGKYRR